MADYTVLPQAEQTVVCVCVEHEYHHMWRVSTNAITKRHTPSLVHKVTIYTNLLGPV